MATLDFKGKTLVQNYHLTVKYHELVPKKDKSISDKVRLDDNLIIHGDNLKALKALLPTYAGKVKCICVDPPYNTGNERWAYNDNVNSPMMQEWLGKAVDREDLTRHDKWLCMMLPRLKLLKELLRHDGVIFVSIDDNEIHHLRALMDEVFGEDNFVAMVTVLRNPKGGVMAEGFAQNHEFLLVYSNTAELRDFAKDKSPEEIAAQYEEEDANGKFRTLELRNTHRGFGKHNRPNLFFPLFVSADGSVSVEPGKQAIKILPIWDDGYDGCWTWNKEKCAKDSQLLVARMIGERWKVFRKAYAQGATKKPTTVWQGPEFQTEKGQRLADEIFGERKFYAPKPLGLLKEIISFATGPDDIVLDSFGGSGTTAHAVLALNKEDGGNRKFILVECEDYADTITAERVRRVIKGVKGASDENLKKGLGGTFSYFELGKAIELDSILDGKNLPSYLELARYVFYTATGEEFDERKLNEKRSFVGESKTHEVYLFYQPDIDHLKKTALTLERAESLGKIKDKRRLVFAPTKYLDQEQLDALRIDFAQLPFEIYKLAQ